MNILPDDPAWLGKKHFSNKYYSWALPNSREVNQIIRETSLSTYIYIFSRISVKSSFVRIANINKTFISDVLFRRIFYLSQHGEFTVFLLISKASRRKRRKKFKELAALSFFQNLPCYGRQKRNTLLNEADSAIARSKLLKSVLVDVVTVHSTCNPLLLQQPCNIFHDNVRDRGLERSGINDTSRKRQGLPRARRRATEINSSPSWTTRGRRRTSDAGCVRHVRAGRLHRRWLNDQREWWVIKSTDKKPEVNFARVPLDSGGSDMVKR